MYCDDIKLKVTMGNSKVKIFIGMIFNIFFGVGVVGGLIDYGEMRPNLYIYILLMLPFVWMVYSAIKKRKMVEKTRRLNQVFKADEDGYIPMSQLVETLKAKNEDQAARIIEKLIGKGFLTNCTNEHKPYEHVVLIKDASGEESNVVTTQCPSCGGTVEKRQGFSTPCPYCGTKVS